MFDRVLAKLGRKQWWANLSGRMKGQQMWSAHRAGATVVRAVQDAQRTHIFAATLIFNQESQV